MKALKKITSNWRNFVIVKIGVKKKENWGENGLEIYTTIHTLENIIKACNCFELEHKIFV